jgi:hypothetical protein
MVFSAMTMRVLILCTVPLLSTQGVTGVTHAVICHDDENKDPNKTRLKMVVEGDNLLGVMGTRGQCQDMFFR